MFACINQLACFEAKKPKQVMAKIHVRIKELFDDDTSKLYPFVLTVCPTDSISDLKSLIEGKRKWRAIVKAQTLIYNEKELKNHLPLKYYDISNESVICFRVNTKINYALDRLNIPDQVRYHPSKASQHDDDCRCGGFGPSKGLCRDSWIWNCCGNFKENSSGCKWKVLTDLDKIKLKMEWMSDKYNGMALVAGFIRSNVKDLNITMDDVRQTCFDFMTLEIEYFHPEKPICNTYYCCLGKPGSIGCKSKWIHPEY
eukprot:600377_1